MTNEHQKQEIIDLPEIHVPPSNEEKTFSLLIYILSFFTAIIGPLIIWLLKRNESEFIDYHGKEYFNLVISFFVYEIIAALSVIILIGAILVPLVSITFIVFIILGAVKSYQGEYYRFPFIFRIIK